MSRALVLKCHETRYYHKLGTDNKDLTLADGSCRHCNGTGISGTDCRGPRVYNEKTMKWDWEVRTPMTCACVFKAMDKLPKVEENKNDGTEESAKTSG